MKDYFSGLKLVVLGTVIAIAFMGSSLAFASSFDAQLNGEPGIIYLVSTGDCYVIADNGDYLGRINLLTGSVNTIDVVDPPNGENIAIDPSDYVIYNVAGEKTATPLIIIDEVTAATNIVNSDIGLYDVDALSFNPVNGTLYAVKSDYHASSYWLPGILYTIEKSTGDTTMVTDLNFPSPDPLASAFDPHIDGIAFHPETGTLYAAYSAWASKSYLVIIDMTSGDMALVGGPSGDPGYTGVDDIEDIAFSPDGTLYAVLGDQGALGGNASGSFEGLVTLDLTTAQATPIGEYGEAPNSCWDMEAIAIAVPLKHTPPPETPVVGIEVMPVDKASLMLPWLNIAGLTMLAIVIGLFIKRLGFR